MTTPRDPNAMLAAYLDDGMTVLPDRVVNAVLDEAHRTRQRTVLRPWATRSTFTATLSAAAVVALLVVGAALLQRSRLDVSAPSTSPEASASPTPPAVVTVTPTPNASPVTNPAGVWIATGTMGTPRGEYSAVRLLDGRVLVLGGSSGDGSDVTSAEVYDPVTGTWSATGNMLSPIGFPPTLLRDGRVLAGHALDEGRPGAELYDPISETWSATGQMVRAADFVGDTATLLPDGRVLVIGLSAGDPGSCPANSVCPGGGAELYDPDSDTWTATGKMITPRYYATATLLPDGRVLVAGGYVIPDVVTDAAELYDPSTGSWTAVANMPARFGHHTATLLREGRVLVAGWSGGPQLDMAVYDPATGTWTALPVRPGIAYGTATLLADGRVLMANDAFDSVAAGLYDPSTGSWIAAAPMLRSQAGSAILLLDGTVLVAGGNDCLEQVCVATGAAELYVPAGVVPPPLPDFPAPPPPVIPTPTPRPSPYPPAIGPVPPNARPWTVTVVNDSDQPATLFLAEDDGSNTLDGLCGSVTPNVVPAESTMEVSFLLPAKNVRLCSFFVNPVPGDPGGLFETSEAPKAGRVWITADGQVGWLGP